MNTHLVAYDLEAKDARLISRILSLYYLENLTQAQIGKQLHLSTAKVNRLIKSARAQGLVEINIKIPFQKIFDLECRIEEKTGVEKAIVVPIFSDIPQTVLQAVGEAAASFLLSRLQDGDTLCIGGGQSLNALVQALTPSHPYAVRVVPSIGGVQGRNETDVNNIADQLAKKLGGQSFQIHAPAFADSPQERDTLINLRQVKEVLDMARAATIGLVGVGNIDPDTSSFFRFTSLPPQELKKISFQEQGVGEILAQVYDQQGHPCAAEYAERVIGITLDELRRIPLTIGIAALSHKAAPLAGALRAHLLKAVVMDEGTARAVLELLPLD